MQLNRKYLVAVALLAALAVVFGAAGTAVTMSKPVSPQSSPSDGVAHFQNPPTFDSGWMDITDKAGQSFSVTHDLNTTDALVDVVGRQSSTSVNHKLFFDSTVYLPPQTNRTYGGAYSDWAASVIRTSDGGYALAGYTQSYGLGGQDFWLVKVNSDLDVEWNQTYGGGSNEVGYSVIQTSDGGYTIAGRTYSYGAGLRDFWLVRTDSTGDMLWNRTFGGSRDDFCHAVVETNDGGFAMAGYTSSFGFGQKDFWLVKTDSNGNHLWNRTYGGTEDDYAYSLVQTADGAYVLAGYTGSYGAGLDDFWLVKTDSLGFKLWSRTYGGSSTDRAYSLVHTGDGGYALAGETHSYGPGTPSISNFWLVKADSLGFKLWNRTYGGAAYNKIARALIQTSDGGYAMAGYRDSYDGDIWVVKTDSVGVPEWDRVYNTLFWADDGYSLVETSEGGYAIAGYTECSLWSAGYKDFWLVKIGVGEVGSSLGLSMTGFANSTITFYRGSEDPFWNYIRVRIWVIEEPTWIFGDINQDGIVDAKDLAIVGQNYGATFSLLSLGGILGILGIQTYKSRKRLE